MKNLTNRWVVLLLVLPHLSIYYYKLPLIQPVVLGLQLLVVFIALYLIYSEMNKFNLILLLFILTTIFSTVYNKTTTSGIILSSVSLISFCIYISFALKNPKQLLTGLFYLFCPLVLVNFFQMLFGFNINIGGSDIYLIGGKNAIEITVLPAIPISYLYSYVHYNKLRISHFIFILLCILSIYLSKSSTAIIVSLLTVGFLFVNKRLLPSFNKYFIVFTAIFLSVVIFRLQDVLFGDFIINTLHKDLTFTGRTFLWDIALSGIKESWFIGMGRGSNLISLSFANLNETHNGILEIFLTTGALGLLLFLVVIFLVSKKLKENKSHLYSKTLSFFVFAYLIIGLMESAYLKKEFWLLIILAYGVNKIIEGTEAQQINEAPNLGINLNKQKIIKQRSVIPKKDF